MCAQNGAIPEREMITYTKIYDQYEFRIRNRHLNDVDLEGYFMRYLQALTKRKVMLLLEMYYKR